MSALPDIERWNPSLWDDDIGNPDVKEFFQDQLYALRTGRIEKGVNTYVRGLSRSGKTSTVRLFARCLMCVELNLETLNPCGHCEACTTQLDRFGEQGMFSYLRGRDVHFMPIDCMQIRGADHLRDLISGMADYNGVKVILLDEISRLSFRGLDELLLGPLQSLNYMWIATSIDSHKIDAAVLNRFPAKFTTVLPTTEELAMLLMRLCRQWGIPYDDPATLCLLAEASNNVTGIALHALAQVNAKRGDARALTRHAVEGFRDRLAG
ncbi:hypothetical protein [Lacipirellula sp.]|uniref:hypothetical protein n=1 Tax=Lacipirellula sp. TaxID=2691419 RepID=UPI003D1510C7